MNQPAPAHPPTEPNDPAPPDHRALAAWLRDHDEDCPVCAYSLRGVPSPACPECNAPISLGVRSPHAIAGPWSLALISFSLALGFDAVMSLILLAPLIATAGEDAEAIIIWSVMIALGAVSGVGVAWLLTRRRVWMRLSPPAQWRAALTIFVGVGLLHLVAGGALVVVLNV